MGQSPAIIGAVVAVLIEHYIDRHGSRRDFLATSRKIVNVLDRLRF